MIFSTDLSNGISLFSDHMFYGRTSANCSTTLVSLLSKILGEWEPISCYTADLQKVIKLVVTYNKYSESEELQALKTFMALGEIRFGAEKHPLSQLWSGKRLTKSDSQYLATEVSLVAKKPLLFRALWNVLVNESLALGLITFDDELVEPNGDAPSEEEPVVPVAPVQSFHFAQLPLEYCDVVVDKGFASIKGYEDCGTDSVKLVARESYAFPVPAKYVSALTYSAPNIVRSWGSTTARLDGWRSVDVSTPGPMSTVTASGTVFDFVANIATNEARKILLEFSAPVDKLLTGFYHKHSIGRFGGFFKLTPITNAWEFRWLADNLLEIVVNGGVSNNSILDLPAPMTNDTLESSYASGTSGASGFIASACKMRPKGSSLTAVVAQSGMNITYSLPNGPTSLRPMRSGNPVDTAFANTFETVGTYSLPAESAYYPVSFDAIGDWRIKDGSLALLANGLKILSSQLPSLLASTRNGSGEFVLAQKVDKTAIHLGLNFSGAATLVSARCLKAKLGGYSAGLAGV